MPNRDVFALQQSGFEGFLFAAVGTEPNGSRLTVLSALARLGEDPWAKAAIWARMPKEVASQELAAAIAQMPVTPEDKVAAADTAARLVWLLSPAVAVASHLPGFSGLRPRTRWAVMLAMLACATVLIGGAILVSRQGTGAPSMRVQAASPRYAY